MQIERGKTSFSSNREYGTEDVGGLIGLKYNSVTLQMFQFLLPPFTSLQNELLLHNARKQNISQKRGWGDLSPLKKNE